MRPSLLFATMLTLVIDGAAAPRDSQAQVTAPPPATREAELAGLQAEKARRTRPYQPGVTEALVRKVDEFLVSGHVRGHPFFGTAYPGAGFTLGAGYMWHLGDYDSIDLRAARSLHGSTRVEAEYRLPRLLARRATLTALGGWREGLEQSFFGLGTAPTSVQARTAFDFRQASTSVRLDVSPMRSAWRMGAGLTYAKYEQRVTSGSAFAQAYSADTLPGYGATVTYLQSQGTAALDWRPADGYTRRGGFLGVTARRTDDTSGGNYSFRQVDYEAVQHVPVLRDAWVISLRGRVETTATGRGQQVPFFLLPSLGSGATLRGFSSWRFRDRNSLLLSAEWRILVNAFADAALFYDAGKVTRHRGDLDLTGLKSNVGIGFLLHTCSATPLRIDLARGNEGFVVVFASSAAF
jgi:hypothetical protein